MEGLGVVRLAVAMFLLAWLPGYAWSRALLPDVGRVERLVLSVGLSIALMTVSLYAGSVLFGIRIGAAQGVWWSLALSAAAAGALLTRRWGPRLLAAIDR